MATVGTEGAGGDAGGVAVVMGLPVDVPGENPDLWGAVLAQSGLGMASWKRAREIGERACTGTTQWAREGTHAERSAARPPPGTRAWRGGGPGSGGPHVCKPPGNPGSSGPDAARVCGGPDGQPSALPGRRPLPASARASLRLPAASDAWR